MNHELECTSNGESLTEEQKRLEDEMEEAALVRSMGQLAFRQKIKDEATRFLETAWIVVRREGRRLERNQ